MAPHQPVPATAPHGRGAGGCAPRRPAPERRHPPSELTGHPALAREAHQQPLQQAHGIGHKSHVADECGDRFRPLTTEHEIEQTFRHAMQPLGSFQPDRAVSGFERTGAAQCRSRHAHGKNRKHGQGPAPDAHGHRQSPARRTVSQLLVEIHPEPHRSGHQQRGQQGRDVADRPLVGEQQHADGEQAGHLPVDTQQAHKRRVTAESCPDQQNQGKTKGNRGAQAVGQPHQGSGREIRHRPGTSARHYPSHPSRHQDW